MTVGLELFFKHTAPTMPAMAQLIQQRRHPAEAMSLVAARRIRKAGPIDRVPAIPAQHSPEVLRILRVFMGHATARAGCAGFSLAQDLTNSEALTISDRWSTRDDLDEHVRSNEYRLLLTVIGAGWGVMYLRADGTVLTKPVHFQQTLNGPIVAIAILF